MFPKNKKVHSLYLYYNATGPFIWKTPYLKYLKFLKAKNFFKKLFCRRY